MSDATHLKEYQWKKGESGNLKGRPISIVKKIKEKFAADPDTFDEWIDDYLQDKQNKKHIVEMLEGKPKQSTDITSDGDKIAPLLVKIIGKDEQDNGDTN